MQTLDNQVLAYSIPDFARRTSLSVATVWRRVYDGTIPTISIGKRRLVPADALQALISVPNREGNNGAA